MSLDLALVGSSGHGSRCPQEVLLQIWKAQLKLDPPLGIM